MYFVPEKGRLYRWAVQIKPAYRYGATIGCVTMVIAIWFCVIEPWLESQVLYEQAALMRTQQQMIEMRSTQRSINVADQQLNKINNEIDSIKRDTRCHNQFAAVCDVAQKSGIQITAFNHEKEKQKKWRSKNYKSLSATGSLDQCMRFLSQLAHTPMIQCKQLALQRADQGLFSLRAQLEFIAI